MDNHISKTRLDGQYGGQVAQWLAFLLGAKIIELPDYVFRDGAGDYVVVAHWPIVTIEDMLQLDETCLNTGTVREWLDDPAGNQHVSDVLNWVSEDKRYKCD